MQIHMKTNKTLISTWLLGGFAFILILSSLISFLFQSNLDLPETLSHHILFTHNDLENIEKIVVKNQLGKFVLQKSTATSTKWHLIEPRSFPANPQTLKNIYDALKKISIMRILKKDAINISHYSLNKPFMELEFYDKNNRPTYVQFGIINPIDNSTYITHSGYNEIFQIKTLPYSIEGLILSDFLDARIFHTTKDEIHALTIYRGLRKYNSPILTIEKKDDQTWLFNNRPYLKNDINDYLDTLLGLRVQMILDKITPETQKSIEQYFNNPLYTIEIKTGIDMMITYSISNIIDSLPDVKIEKKSSFIVRVSNVDSPLIVQKENLDALSFKEKAIK
ncbi:MAG: hypothetical protein A2381_14995 [Bdellovibrionales bacterium RIFOXYB1_FULL_37_110]|nr:MAG: hypothetical protein A2417_10500 [Bdellovibrionales bacterium RIFOXYC1_FULL_37_79]OFZ60171.1 MAG: hypothetical protein A2381_14995 [Bdellovibrionales bacterium RIFOXYB1_FULL_37_110]OFZ64335.1 MAG: hypothetical protein A2577_09775 [Bdellovibrionales bacterium RIFOXYD1_FULL_36_51]